MIRLEHVSHDFMHQDHTNRILNDINLEIKKQEIFGLVGHTGSGKSTLLRIMNGFIEASEGNVYLFDEKLNHNNKKRLVKKTSMIFQHFNLLSNLNVLDNVMLPNKIRKIDKTVSKENALKYLKYVGLEGYENRYIKTLSGGQKQRVAIARTLMSEPEVILCDEPTSALDGKMRHDILKLLKDINEAMGTTIVLVSHDISVIKSLCHRVAILEEGTIQDVIDVKYSSIKIESYQEALGHV